MDSGVALSSRIPPGLPRRHDPAPPPDPTPTTGQLKALLWNTEGLRSVLQHSPEHVPFQEADVLFLTETFIYDASHVRIPNFKLFLGLSAKPTAGRPKWGVALGVRSRIWAKQCSASARCIVIEGPDC